MKRRILYWGVPYIGGLIGTAWTVKMMIKKEESKDYFGNQIDAFIGIVIWLSIQQVVIAVLKLTNVL